MADENKNVNNVNSVEATEEDAKAIPEQSRVETTKEDTNTIANEASEEPEKENTSEIAGEDPVQETSRDIDVIANEELENTMKKEKSQKNSKKKKMDPLSRVILTISIIVFLGSGGFLLYKYIGEPLLEQWALSAYKDDYQSENTPSANNGIWNKDEDEDEERLENGILASFKNIIELNNDVVGWITVPNTPIDYPVTQTTDNSYYLTHNINKETNSSGCPFVDYRNIIEMDNLSRCTIIYAHHRRNGTMFAKLTNYNDIDFYKENPVIRFDTIYNRNEWVIFANFRTTVSTATGTPFEYLRTDFEDDDDFTDFISEIRKRSLIDTPVDVTADDEILLLSTCSYEKANWRMVIAARKVRDDETTIDVSSAAMASNPLMP